MGGGASTTNSHAIQTSLQKIAPTITIRSRSNSTSLHHHDSIKECPEDFSIDFSIVDRKFPCFENYLTEKCTLSELEHANESRLKINTLPHYLEFDNTFYKTLNEACTDMPFVLKPFSYKKHFVVELMRLLTSSKPGFAEKVCEFVHRRQYETVSVEDYGLLGQVFLATIETVRGEEERRLWAKAYSRFLRALLSQGDKLGIATEETTVSLG